MAKQHVWCQVPHDGIKGSESSAARTAGIYAWELKMKKCSSSKTAVKKTMIILLALLIIAVLLYVGSYKYEKRMSNHYEDDYFGVFNLPHSFLSKEDIYSILGVPLNEGIDETKTSRILILTYTNSIYRFRWSSFYSKWDFACAETAESQYRFGRNQIGVGSTRKEIEYAYRWQTPISECGAGEGYVDCMGAYYVYFAYSAEDTVVQVSVYR